MLMQWGQFLDHDLDLSHTGSEEMDIPVPLGDQHFQHPIRFNRSEYVTEQGTPTRQQVNAITAYIDASQIYGSSWDQADALRVKKDNDPNSLGWKLKMTATEVGSLLYFDQTKQAFVSGDERVNEQVGLTAMHTLFNREHNRLGLKIEDELSKQKAFLKLGYQERDEVVFQETRKVVGAMMQSITYNEFLPVLLGSASPGPVGSYDETIDAGIANEFSTAAFRFGHSTLSSTFARIDEHGDPIEAGNLPLKDAFFNSSLLMDPKNEGIEPILRGLAAQHAQEVDPFIVDAVRNLLFATPTEIGFDLAALNMQRGRDHGLPGYNSMREAMNLTPFTDWATMDAIMLEGATDMLKEVYNNDINAVDLWIGGLAERHVNGGMVGELFAAIIQDQFLRLRDGDRFWYRAEGMFEDDWLQYIENSTLSAIITRNTDITRMKANVFVVAEPMSLLLLLSGIVAAAWQRRTSS
jgi:hypothetical protein